MLPPFGLHQGRLVPKRIIVGVIGDERMIAGPQPTHDAFGDALLRDAHQQSPWRASDSASAANPSPRVGSVGHKESRSVYRLAESIEVAAIVVILGLGVREASEYSFVVQLPCGDARLAVIARFGHHVRQAVFRLYP